MDRQKTQTTYADLRPDDQIEDKAGNLWRIADLSIPDFGTANSVTFWLANLATGIATFSMVKEPSDPVTVHRLQKHADQVAKLEAEFPSTETVTPDEAEAELTETLGATVDLEATAAEIDAAIEAEDTGLPVELIDFAEMTDIEKRSHLYVLHGIYATDLQSRAQLDASHDLAHEGAVTSRSVPHVHKAAS
jgi:hypothetical protein